MTGVEGHRESTVELLNRPRAARSVAPPKGILKNAPAITTGPGTPNSGQHLQWDEDNIALTEVQKDSLMKITEPKTPYVRYNALTDEVEGEIPDLDLGKSHTAESPTEDNMMRSETPEASENGSRRTSFSSTGRGSGKSGSRSSSRSTSFSIPNEGSGKDEFTTGELEEENMDAETLEKHRAFLKARLKHYANEGVVMKARAQTPELEEEVDEKEERDGEIHRMNGSI